MNGLRSFVLRTGRATKAQERAMAVLLPHYGLPDQGVLDLDSCFGRSAPRYLEIGFGMGGALLAMAAAHPEQDYLGVEVHTPGVGCLLQGLEQQALTNVRVICSDAVGVLRDQLSAQSLDGIYIFFPDPWHKTRHHKRRLISPTFVQSLARVLKPEGLLHLATDWADYARHMLKVLEAEPAFINPQGAGVYAERPAARPLTKFEARGQRLGHGVWDLIYRRQADTHHNP